MNHYQINVPMYNWLIDIYIGITIEDKDDIKTLLLNNNCSEQDISVVLDSIKPNIYNSGNTLWDDDNLKQIILFTKFTNPRSALRIILHELRHSVDFMVKTHNLELEGAAYLNGWIGEALYDCGFVNDILNSFNK